MCIAKLPAKEYYSKGSGLADQLQNSRNSNSLESKNWRNRRKKPGCREVGWQKRSKKVAQTWMCRCGCVTDGHVRALETSETTLPLKITAERENEDKMNRKFVLSVKLPTHCSVF